MILPHGINIVVNESAIIGNNVTIYQGVTVGIIHTGKRSGVPTIEDNCVLGPNSVIVGGVTIGSGSIIAGNTFVNFDVPANSVVIGNVASIHTKS